MRKMNVQGFDELQKQIEKLNDKLEGAQVEEFNQALAKELAARLLRKVVKRTPIGKKPTVEQLGGAEAKKTIRVKGSIGKSKTFLSREGAILQTHWSGYAGGTLRRGWTVRNENVTKSGNAYEIEIVNPVSYASYVEYGHRQEPGRFVPAIGRRLKKAWVPGKFMLAKSEKEIQQQAPKAIEKKLKNMLEEVLK